jgi:hypothetical protein
MEAAPVATIYSSAKYALAVAIVGFTAVIGLDQCTEEQEPSSGVSPTATPRTLLPFAFPAAPPNTPNGNIPVASDAGTAGVTWQGGGLGCNIPPSSAGQFAIASATENYAPTPITGDLICSTTVPGNCFVQTLSGDPNTQYTTIIGAANTQDASALLAVGPFTAIPSSVAFYPGALVRSGSNYSWLLSSTGRSNYLNTTLQEGFNVNGVGVVQVTGTYIGLDQPIGGGNGTTIGAQNPLTYYREAQVLDAGTVVMDASVYVGAHLIFSGTLTGNTTVVFPSVIGACWFTDVTFVVFSGFTITYQANGVNWGTVIDAGASEYYVCYGDIGRLFGTTLNQ